MAKAGLDLVSLHPQVATSWCVFPPSSGDGAEKKGSRVGARRGAKGCQARLRIVDSSYLRPELQVSVSPSNDGVWQGLCVRTA
jgi:hypothetical protein